MGEHKLGFGKYKHRAYATVLRDHFFCRQSSLSNMSVLSRFDVCFPNCRRFLEGETTPLEPAKRNFYDYLQDNRAKLMLTKPNDGV